MSRQSLFHLALASSTLGLIGCGGSKTDFSVQPLKYSLQTVSPASADGVTVTGVSRDGRVVGTYLKGAVKTIFGWTPDGTATDITPPASCKEFGGINELGGVLGADRVSVPHKLFRWQGGSVDPINTPTGAVIDSFGTLTYDSLFLVNLHIGAGKTRGYQLSITENPKAITTDDGGVTGSSLNGDFVGYDKVGALTQAIAVISKEKVSLGLFGGKATIAYGVNDNGMVVGTSDPGLATRRAFKWSKGSFTNLANPVGATATMAVDVTNGGVVGGSATVSGISEACVWFPSGAPVLVKSLLTLPFGVHLDRVRLVTPLGIVICEGTRTKGAETKAEVFALFPEFP